MEVVDGSAKFKVRDERLQALIDLVYPVGIVVAIADKSKPEFMEYGTWEEVASGRVLQGGDNPGTTIEAGLPNITGASEAAIGTSNNITIMEGAMYFDKTVPSTTQYGMSYSSRQASSGRGKSRFDASLSNSIYGASTTVQPPAYVVKFYRRTA